MKDVLEQGFRDGILTSIQQDELLELLERENRLETWLDDNVQLFPDENILYSDKDFLKSIAEPFERLKPDESIIYRDKNKLYRKNIALNIFKKLRVATILIIMLLTSVMFKRTENNNHNQLKRREVVVPIEKNIVAVDDRSMKVVVIEPILGKRLNEYYISINKFNINLDNFQDKLEARIKEIKIPVIKGITRVIISSEVVIKDTPELVLFAQAEQWEGINEQYEKEIIIDNEEWLASEVVVRNRVGSILNNIKKHIDISSKFNRN